VRYSFRNSANGDEFVVELDDYTLTLHGPGRKEVVPYAGIVAVRICKQQNHSYRIFLYPDANGPIVISSLSWDGDGVPRDQSREYALFVRVLHHHLKDKSPAVFTSGGDAAKIWKLGIASAALSLMVVVAINYLSLGLAIPYVQALFFAAMVFLMVIAFSIRNFPKSYVPTDIPLHFLP
jgi:hypothetical protein